MTLIKTAGPGAFISLRKGKVSVLFFFQVCGLEDKTFFFNNQDNGSRRMVDSFLVEIYGPYRHLLSKCKQQELSSSYQ